MKLQITSANKVENPLQGFAFAFIDAEDKKLKIKKHDSIIEFSNILDDVQLLDLTDYTAFEVFAHDYDIPVGECEELGGYISLQITASREHQFTIRSLEGPAKQDIIVDWGDGTLIKLSDMNVYASNGEYKYLMNHTYLSNGKYIIKIYGKKYFAIIQSSSNTDPNILCRIFDYDLPIASHLRNFSSFCRHSKHLINVDVSKSPTFSSNYINIANMFTGCKNLLSVTGFGGSSISKINVSYAALFYQCSALTTTDFKLIPTDSSIKQVFRECSNLEVDINDVLSNFYVLGGKINTNTTFNNCKKTIWYCSY